MVTTRLGGTIASEYDPSTFAEVAVRRIVLLVTDLERGGAPLRIAELARRLPAFGWEPHVGCLAPPGPVGALLEAAGIATFACDARGAADWPALLRLRRQLRETQPALIHGTLLHANVAARIASCGLGIPVLASTATIERERRWHLWVERLLAPWDAGHLVNSRALARHVAENLGVFARRVHRVPPLVASPHRSEGDRARLRDACRQELRLCDDCPVIAWAGRLDRVKRVDVLIRAAAIAQSRPMLILAGEGPERGRLVQLTERLGMHERVRWLGWCDDLGPILAAADLFAFPSLTEGQPTALLQALAAGQAAVAQDIAPHRELAERGSRLALVDGGTEAWAAAIDREWSAPEKRRLRAAAAAAWARRELDPDRAVERIAEVYNSTLRRSL